MPPSKPRVSVVWFKSTDLRLHDHVPLHKAHAQPYPVIHLFVFDPFWFRPLPITRLPKTGPIRAKFLVEAVHDLRQSLQDQGASLTVRHCSAVDAFRDLLGAFEINAVYAYKEVCSQEVKIERRVGQLLATAPRGSGGAPPPRLSLDWGFTLYHKEDLPADVFRRYPRSYTGFRKIVEEQSWVRPPIGMDEGQPPLRLRPAVKDLPQGDIPSLEALGLQMPAEEPRAACVFIGGEMAGMARVKEYLWDRDLLRYYVGSTNTMTPGKSPVGEDSTTKFSPWLAHGCISPQWLYREIEMYERRRTKNKSTYWLKHELIWRDYLRFGALAEVWGDDIFKLAGVRQELASRKWTQDQDKYRMWVEGRTGFPFVDCFMRELAATGFTNYIGREIVSWFLCRDLASEKGWLDWRMGAEYFEYILVDFEPSVNWGMWSFRIAPTTPSYEITAERVARVQSVEMLLWAHDHDWDAVWVKRWLPELRSLPAALALEPWRLLADDMAPHLDRGAEWACPACTFLNPPRRDKCDMCKTSRPAVFRGFAYGADYPFACVVPTCGRRRPLDLSDAGAGSGGPSHKGGAGKGGRGPAMGRGGGYSAESEKSPPEAAATGGRGLPEASAQKKGGAGRGVPRSKQRNRIQTDRR